MMAMLRHGLYLRRSRRIVRGLDLRESDDPLIDAYREARASGLIGDVTFRQFSHAGNYRMPRYDRRLERKLRKQGH